MHLKQRHVSAPNGKHCCAKYLLCLVHIYTAYFDKDRENLPKQSDRD